MTLLFIIRIEFKVKIKKKLIKDLENELNQKIQNLN
jgi:hypothetical protein